MIWCLAAAALWAVAVSMLRTPIRTHGAAAANLGKCLLAAAAFWLLVPLTGGLGARGNAADWSLLALSGVVGMAAGDLCLFLAVRHGGVQRALVIFNSSPLLAALGAIPVYGEWPAAGTWLGMLLVIAGVTLVESDPVRRREARPDATAPPRSVLFYGLGAAAGQAAGILLSRGPLQAVPLVPASAVRLSAAAIALVALLPLAARRRAGLRSVTPAALRDLALPTLIGTVIAVLFMMRGIRDVPAAISSSLLATTPIFSLPIARFVLAEPLGARSVAGTLLAVAGIAVMAA
ncbi:MAG: DMT family transporter [Acidobacteriota bacterium]